MSGILKKHPIIRKFFDASYSVNDLVNTASGKEINHFIYKTLFENDIISKPEETIRFRKKSGLKKLLEDTQNTLLKRKERVDSIIEPFNKNQKNILRIVYSQNQTLCKKPELSYWLFERGYSKNSWYKKYNISQENVIEYLIKLSEELGIFNFLTMIINLDVAVANKITTFLDFCIKTTPNMIEKNITSLKAEQSDEVVKQIFFDLITDNNISEVTEYLRKYVSDIEEFSLEFNINNKEGNSSAPIYKPVGILSLGQKVVAMLSFILGYSEYSEDYRPLIIDQPEDNLDNQYIYKNLVTQLRLLKEKRQVIIATHNATIVTNAKADQVCVMTSNNENGWVDAVGYPNEDRIKKHIINHLEGGRDSFLHKCRIYAETLKDNNK